MNIYLDDNQAGPGLAGLLRQAGHAVILPADVGLYGATDARHLEYAIRHDRIMLTADRDDFRDLHDLVLASGGSHPGILLIRFDRDPKKNMKPKHIVTAIGKLEQSGPQLTNQLIVLNHWR